MDVIVTGATGGIGSCLVKQAEKSKNIGTIYCRYRSQKKFDRLFGESPLKIIAEEHSFVYEKEDSYLMQELYKNKPESIACIFTAFTINPIKRAGTYLPKEIADNVHTNILDIVMLTNWLIEYKKTCLTQLRLINIDSGAAYRPLEGWGLYSASKAYINMFFQTVQLENPDVKVVSYEPGVVDTPMQDTIRKVDETVFDQVNLFKEYFEKKVLRKPDKIAEDILNLNSSYKMVTTIA